MADQPCTPLHEFRYCHRRAGHRGGMDLDRGTMGPLVEVPSACHGSLNESPVRRASVGGLVGAGGANERAHGQGS